ncbi:MAG: hypothetical protein V4718_04325 [Pseudomonadota bacterium]
MMASTAPNLVQHAQTALRLFPCPVMGDREREQHIKSCGDKFLIAYEQYTDTKDPAYREEALKWLNLQNDAINGRSQAAQTMRHAAFERALNEGPDFFQTEGQLDGRAIALRNCRR